MQQEQRIRQPTEHRGRALERSQQIVEPAVPQAQHQNAHRRRAQELVHRLRAQDRSPGEAFEQRETDAGDQQGPAQLQAVAQQEYGRADEKRVRISDRRAIERDRRPPEGAVSGNGERDRQEKKSEPWPRRRQQSHHEIKPQLGVQRPRRGQQPARRLLRQAEHRKIGEPVGPRFRHQKRGMQRRARRHQQHDDEADRETGPIGRIDAQEPVDQERRGPPGIARRRDHRDEKTTDAEEGLNRQPPGLRRNQAGEMFRHHHQGKRKTEQAERAGGAGRRDDFRSGV